MRICLMLQLEWSFYHLCMALRSVLQLQRKDCLHVQPQDCSCSCNAWAEIKNISLPEAQVRVAHMQSNLIFIINCSWLGETLIMMKANIG